MEFLEFIKDYK